jgi:serine acetyltransferase
VPRLAFRHLVWSDYRAHFAERPEPLPSAALKFPIRLLLNPSLQFALLVRVAQCGPTFLQHPIRWLQIVLFSSECYWFRGGDERVQIGPGINFPHPANVFIGSGTVIGSNVTIYNNVTLGTDMSGAPDKVWERAPVIGDGAFVYGYGNVQGPRTVGRNGVVGKWIILTEDVPPGALMTPKGVRLKGEWDRSRIWPNEPKHPDSALAG